MSAGNRPKVKIYSDGGCTPNPGPGGWAAVILHPGQPPLELSGSETQSTNNRMELRAAIQALKSLSGPSAVDFYTDSVYLRSGITEWLPTWQRKGWKLANKSSVKNQDLWRELSDLIGEHDISWHWTKGHAGDKWNDRADHLARAAIPRQPLPLNDPSAVHLFAATSYRGKERVGAWGVVLRYGNNSKELSGRVSNSSPNALHIRAAVEGLAAITRRTPVHFYTTSGYLYDGASRWLPSWQKRDWKKKDGTGVKHKTLWEKLAVQMDKYSMEWHLVPEGDVPEELKHAKRLASQVASRSR